MNQCVIFADSSCDIEKSVLDSWHVKCIQMKLIIDGSEYNNGEIGAAEFYRDLREGVNTSTAAINPQEFMKIFREETDAGKDVLYLCFSSGLSSMYFSAKNAADALNTEYGTVCVRVVDTLCESAGYGMLLYLTSKKLASGADMEQTASYAEQMRLKIAHWFTVDDLDYLKRGGRISTATAAIGGILNIKPVLHMNDEGKLASVKNVRGRMSAIRFICEKCSENAVENYPVYISHSDCADDAEILRQMLEKHDIKTEMVCDIGPVIGSHSGPGTLAVFYVGANR